MFPHSIQSGFEATIVQDGRALSQLLMSFAMSGFTKLSFVPVYDHFVDTNDYANRDSVIRPIRYLILYALYNSKSVYIILRCCVIHRILPPSLLFTLYISLILVAAILCYWLLPSII